MPFNIDTRKVGIIDANGNVQPFSSGGGGSSIDDSSTTSTTSTWSANKINSTINNKVSNKISVSSTQPSNPSVNDIWIVV